jgi:uncharacterized membrane protein (DUF485 family)
MLMAKAEMNWAAIDADPRFQALHKKKLTFLWGLMIFSVIYYFLLPIGAAYATDLFKIKIAGYINFGYMFALSQFFVSWGLAHYYAHVANKDFDRLTRDLVNELAK